MVIQNSSSILKSWFVLSCSIWKERYIIFSGVFVLANTIVFLIIWTESVLLTLISFISILPLQSSLLLELLRCVDVKLGHKWQLYCPSSGWYDPLRQLSHFCRRTLKNVPPGHLTENIIWRFFSSLFYIKFLFIVLNRSITMENVLFWIRSFKSLKFKMWK